MTKTFLPECKGLKTTLTQMECDSVNAQIETKLKHKDVSISYEYVKYSREAWPKNPYESSTSLMASSRAFSNFKESNTHFWPFFEIFWKLLFVYCKFSCRCICTISDRFENSFIGKNKNRKLLHFVILLVFMIIGFLL